MDDFENDPRSAKRRKVSKVTYGKHATPARRGISGVFKNTIQKMSSRIFGDGSKNNKHEHGEESLPELETDEVDSGDMDSGNMDELSEHIQAAGDEKTTEETITLKQPSSTKPNPKRRGRPKGKKSKGKKVEDGGNSENKAPKIRRKTSDKVTTDMESTIKLAPSEQNEETDAQPIPIPQVTTDEDTIQVEDEKTIAVQPQSRKLKRPTRRSLRGQSKKSAPVPESPKDEPITEAVEEVVLTNKRSSSRKRKLSVIMEDSSVPPPAPEPPQDETSDHENVEDTPSKRRSGGRKRRHSPDVEDDIIPPSVPELSHNKNIDHEDELNDHEEAKDTLINVRQSSRKRSAPKRYEDELSSVAKTAHTARKPPHSILSPSRKGKSKRAKSVAFEDVEGDELGKMLGFKDIDGHTPNKTRPAKKDDLSPEEFGEDDDQGQETAMFPSLDEILENTEMLNATHTTIQKKASPVAQPPPLKQLPGYANDFKNTILQENLEPYLELLQQIILQKLTHKRRTPLVGLDNEYTKVHQLVYQTVVSGEGNSMLLIGSRGSGKTALVESVIEDISTDHKDQFHVVRLNGFIHTDDRLALKEIWRQLGQEMEIPDFDNYKGPSSYADTLASLLALLSHPSEFATEEDGTAVEEHALHTTTKSVIFVLDEFDLFALHPRQTLLYNLFDIAQARKAPIAVLGLTTRVDVVEGLEKRVRSRFGHRTVFIPNPKGVDHEWWDRAKAMLGIEEEEVLLNRDKDKSKEKLEEKAMLLDDPKGQLLLNAWSTYLSGLHSSNPIFTHLLALTYTTSRALPNLIPSFLLSLLQPPPTEFQNPPPLFPTTTVTLQPPDSILLTTLPTLPSLALALLISASRLETIHSLPSVTFPMVYDEYISLISRSRLIGSAGGGGRVYGRLVARGAWETLARRRFVELVAGSGARGGGEEGELWRVEVGLEEVERVVGKGGWGRWCREA